MKKIIYDDYSVFTQALADVFIPEVLCEELPDIDCEFSAGFLKKMDRLVKRREKPYYDLVSTAGRRAACIGTAMLIAGGSALSVGAVREGLAEFAVKHFYSHDVLRAAVDSETSCPSAIEQEYTISPPQGFVREDRLSVRTPECIVTSYKSESNYILFHQYTVSGFKTKIRAETCEVEYYTDKNGILYTIYHWSRNEGNFDVLWQRNNYVFQLNSDLSRDEVIELCVNIELCSQDTDGFSE